MFFTINDADAREKRGPAMIAVNGYQGVIEVEQGEVHLRPILSVGGAALLVSFEFTQQCHRQWPPVLQCIAIDCIQIGH